MNDQPTPVAIDLARTERTAFLVGLVGAAALVVGFLSDAQRFYESWLMAFLFWLAPTLGSLGLIMLHHMTGGAWGFAIRRLLEAAARNAPYMAVAFVPLALGVTHLYEWTHSDAVAADPVLQHKAAYLNLPFFFFRALLYFAVWIGLSFGIVHFGARYDRWLDTSALRKLKALSGAGILAYVVTMSFASFDWGMSLEPHWFSTIYGMHFVVGQGLSTLCVAVFVAARVSRHEPFSRWFEKSHFHDLGNLMLAFVMLWAYISFSQFLIIWSGNLPEETPWYLNRTSHGWQALALFLVGFHFFVPFTILLTRKSKRNARILARVAVAVFLIRYADVYWLIAPAFAHGGGPHVSWMDAVAVVTLGGLWVGLFVHNLRGKPLVSLQDAKLLGQLEEAPIL